MTAIKLAVWRSDTGEMNMRRYLQTFLDMRDENFLRTHTQAIMKLEYPGTNADKHRASDYIYELLKANGLQAERINLVADGKTVCHDKIQPVCWDVSMGRLIVLSDWDGDPVIADYERHPFHLIQYSTATPAGGVTARLVPYERMEAGEDVTGAMILLPQGMIPTETALVPVLDAGAIGLVNGTATLAASAEMDPDSILWANNCTETVAWHVTADERPFVAFCVSPRMRDRLQASCDAGEVLVKVECDGRRFAGTLPAVTALLPGENEREFWMFAHNGEPLEDDNSSGVVTCINAMLQIRRAVEEKKIPPLKYSLRIVFAPELYGNAAMAVRFGGCLRERCIGAFNADGMPISPTADGLMVYSAPSPIPFYGNLLHSALWDEYNRVLKEPPFVTGWGDYWCSDCFNSDPTVGLPTITAYKSRVLFWHNSHQNQNYIHYPQFANVAAVYAAFAALVTAPDREMIHRFMPVAAAVAMRKLAQTALTPPPRRGTKAEARIAYRLAIELADLRSFALAGAEDADIRKACEMVSTFAASLIPVEAAAQTEPTPVFDSLVHMVPTRTSEGVPHDWARAPFEKRRMPIPASLMSRVFSAMDGQRDLRDLIIEAEYGEGREISEPELTAFIAVMEQLAEYDYITLERT